ncbi:MAG: hypothetical protein ABWK53_00050 [Anaerolineales bacterium]
MPRLIALETGFCQAGRLFVIIALMRARIQRAINLAAFLLFFLCLLSGGAPIPPTSVRERLRLYTRDIEFDHAGWMLDALSIKLGQAALHSPHYFEEAARRQSVLDYLHLTDRILQAESELALLYANPSVADPLAASAPLRAELDSLYAQQRRLAPLAESVLEEQVGLVLTDLGLSLGGQPMPPVLFHISPLPWYLVVSERGRIETLATISLLPDLTVDRQAALEAQIDSALNVSSLVVPVGGIGAYPTMVARTTSLDWLAEVIAHEWIHNWLDLHPLGANYATSPELRTMNETTASIAGKEIGRMVLARFYPELLAEYDAAALVSSAGPVWPQGVPRPRFDFRAEMHTTRLRVDELLAEGRIEEAEAYMEERRQIFWLNGYPIRKLNQAYFAFYGAYADLPGGAAGEDPVGPAVRALRQQCGSLTEFLRTIARMDSFDDLQAAVAR